MLSTKKRFGGGGKRGNRTKRRRRGGLSLKQRARTHRWQLRRQAKMKARRRAQRGHKET